MGYEVLVFLVSALTGFAAYVAGGSRPVPVGRIRSLLTLRRVGILLVVTAGAVAVVVLVIAVVALPGQWLYTVQNAIRLYGPHVILGLVLGLGFSIWLDQLIRPAALVGAHRSTAHRLWGIALAVLFLGGIFMGPVNRLLPQLTGISTPAVSLTFADRGSPAQGIPVSPPSPTSTSSASNDVARSYLEATDLYFQRDSEYVRLLHGDRSFDRWRPLHEKARQFVLPIAKCFATAIEGMKLWGDTGAIHTEFGPASAAGAAWLRSVLAEDDQATARRQRSLLATMYSRLPQCRSRPRIHEVALLPREAYELPYFALTLAHLMQLAGHDQVGAELLAHWINRSLRTSRTDKIPDWYHLRTYIHLSLLVNAADDPLSAYDMLQQSVRMFENTLRQSPTSELRHQDSWNETCGDERRRRGASRRDRGAIRRAESDRDRAIARLRFAFMSQTDQLVRQALYADETTLVLLRHTGRNTAVPKTCYPALRGGPNRSRAEFLTTHGGLLVALASRKLGPVADDGSNLDAYRSARAHLLRALELLRPLAETERALRRHDGAIVVVRGRSNIRREVQEAQHYLRHAETALAMR